MEAIILYTTHWCADCWRAKHFLKQRGVTYREINIEEDASAEAIVLEANHGKRKIPTLKIGERFFACSPFSAVKLAQELNVPLNP